MSKTITFGAACAAKAEANGGDVDVAVKDLQKRIGVNGSPFAFNSQVGRARPPVDLIPSRLDPLSA